MTTNRGLLLRLCLLTLACSLHAAPGPVATSKLWGTAGERWTRTSRLPDFSLAGYRGGGAPIPDVPVVANVKNFGAKGDGYADDTAAIQKAIDTTTNGAVLLPAGRYVLTDPLRIRKSGVVLRGEGTEKTILAPPKPLNDLHPRELVDGGKSHYSFSGGFIEITGGDRGRRVAGLTAMAPRGSRVLRVDATAGVNAGDFIRITMGNDPELGRHIHGDRLDIGEDTRHHRNFFDWVARVLVVTNGALGLDRPLRIDVRPEWKAEIRTFQPTLEEVGVEDLAFEFSGVPKQPHLKEDGHNAIHIRNAVNCWVRGVRIVDADNGIIAGGDRFCTFDQISFPRGKRSDPSGHHALWATGLAQDCLFTRFDLGVKFVHDLTVEGFASGNVFSRGKGIAVNFDHHRNGPFENLFTQIHVGDPKRVWESSGRGDRGPHAGARETFWNVTADDWFPAAPRDWPQLNLIGVPVRFAEKQAEDLWLETANPGEYVVPLNLNEAQRQRRAGL